MNTRRIAIISIFAAVSVILVLSPLKVPAPPPMSFLVFQIWEIPIVLALLLYGLSVAGSISILNTIVLLVIYPGSLPSGPVYNLAAVLSMLLGIYIVHRLAAKHLGKVMALAVSSTAIGCLMRVGVMSVVNYIALPLPFPIGYGSFGMTPQGAIALLPPIGLFNAIVALYTIPTGYFISKIVSNRIPTVINNKPHPKVNNTQERKEADKTSTK
ncbi:MAG: hypothetical protein V1850_01035 [Candidatus Bathyarchaeota archaeon]